MEAFHFGFWHSHKEHAYYFAGSIFYRLISAEVFIAQNFRLAHKILSSRYNSVDNGLRSFSACGAFAVRLERRGDSGISRKNSHIVAGKFTNFIHHIVGVV